MATFADDYVTDYVARFFPETAIQVKKKQESQLITNPRDAVRGQSRSPNVVMDEDG